MKIIWLDQLEGQETALVGGKAANLSRLAAAYPVPPGFCLTTTAFDHWQDWQKSEAPTAQTLPAELHQALAMAYEQLAECCGMSDPPVAVRSSAVDEDGHTASFAGQYQTLLNVVGIEALAKAVAACWVAARSPEALAYRQQHGLGAAVGKMAVLVQQLVDAEVAAVAFSANPINGARNEIVINAVWGLGESLVSGQVTPDIYVVDKHDRAILSQQIAQKRRQTMPTAQGVATVAVSQAQHNLPALTEHQISAVAQLAVDLEKVLGWPVDIECAWQGGALYLLQCRPITTLAAEASSVSSEQFTVTWARPEDAEYTWLGGRELVKPLQQSLSLYYYQGWAAAFRAVEARGSLRVRFVHGYEYRLWQFEPIHAWEQTAAAQQAAARTLPARWAEEWLPAIQSDLARWRAVDLRSLADDELACHLHDLLNRQLQHWTIHAHLGSTPLETVQRLIDWYLQRFPDAAESEPYKLVQGQENVSTRSNHELWKLSNEVNFAIAEALRNSQWDRLPASFATKFNDYLDRFGDGMLDGKVRAAQVILVYAETEVPDPLVAVRQLAAERQQFTDQVRAQLNQEEQAHFDDLLELALAHHPLTEDHNLYLDQQSNAATRRVCDEFARRLVEGNILATAEGIDYLTLYELIQWGFGLCDLLQPRVLERKAEHERNARLRPPTFLGQPLQSAAWTDRFSGPATPLTAESGALRGVGASAGVVRGIARVVKTLEEALTLQPGEILVCPATDPRWTPLFALAAALVTDHGGSLAHAAVIAREYRLPAVVGTHEATQQIKSGQVIEVDGVQGVVRI